MNWISFIFEAAVFGLFLLWIAGGSFWDEGDWPAPPRAHPFDYVPLRKLRRNQFLKK